MSAIDRQSDTRRAILVALKKRAARTATEIAAELEVTSEAVRQHLKQLEADGLIEVAPDREGVGERGGRPAHRYGLTREGDHLFDKRYGDLTVLLVDTVADRLGSQALREVLDAATNARVAALAPRLEGCTTEAQRLRALQAIYLEDDPWIHVEERDDERWLVERNCPYLDVALRRPALCSVTVNTLSRLLGRRVERTRTFQAGQGRCAFRITDEPCPPGAPFRLEPDPGTPADH